MPLQAENSVVADSTLSTSPQREEVKSPHIKRAARTYGRKRSPAPQEDASNALEPPYASVFRTAPSDLTECIPPSSDNEENSHSDTENASRSSKVSHKFQYSWRADLEKLNQASDDDDGDAGLPSGQPPKGTPDAKAFGFGQPSLLLQDKDKDQSIPALDGDVFYGSVDCASPAQSNSDSPVKEARLGRNRKSNSRVVIQDSDSEAEAPTTSPPITTSSPAIVSSTPESRQVSTPPTSDTGMPALRKAKLKGKHKSSVDTRHGVPPLDFVGSPSILQPDKQNDDYNKKKTKPTRVTKKDQAERIKASARMAEDRHVGVPRTETQSKHSKQDFWKTVKNSASYPLSDPINAFSSPEARPLTPSIPLQRTPSPLPGTSASPSRPSLPGIPDFLDSDDETDVLPSAMEVLDGFKKVDPPNKRSGDLKKLKMKAMSEQVPKVYDSDSDLEVLPPSNQAVQKLKAEHSKIPKALTHTRKKQLQLAGVSTNSKATSKKARNHASNRDQFDEESLKAARAEAAAISKQKMKEWGTIGGTMPKTVMVGEGSEAVLQRLAEQGLEATEVTKEQENLYEDSEEGGDSDWDPDEQGSAEPEAENMDMNGGADEDTPMVDEMEEASVDEADETDHVVKPRTRRGQNLVGSDDENDEDDVLPQQRLSLAVLESDGLADGFARNGSQDGPFPFTNGPNDDETDKENDTGLMFDRGDDKENKAVVRFRTLDFNENRPASPLQLSLSLDSSERRRPFQEIPGPSDTPKAFNHGRANLSQLFAAQLSQVRSDPATSSLLSLKPLVNLDDPMNDIDPSLQFSDGEITLLRKSASSNGGLSDLFDATTQRLNPDTCFPEEADLGEAFIEKLFGNSSPKGLSQRDGLDLTQDLVTARPLEIKETQIRKADAVFEKEQEYLLGAAFEPKLVKEELYVNDYGFLTQTRPNMEDPEVYEPPSPTQLQSQKSTLTTPLFDRSFDRSPLATLSLTDPTQFDSHAPLRRLKRRSVSPSERVAASHEKKRPNAFDSLYEGSRKAERQKRRKLDAREFAAAEAEESDDEGGFWGVKQRRDDEEEDGEDLDRTLETLVDDHEMDVETLAEDLVREKFKEDEALTDEKIEAAARAIAKGERRTRKRNGDFMSDGSGDESEDDENKRLRRKITRTWKNREDVEALEHNPQTKSFADTYKMTLIDDDDNEFTHLAQDDTQSILDELTASRDEEEDGSDQEEMGPAGDNDETQPAAMGTSEFNRIVRERMAKHGHLMVGEEDEEDINLNDTTWVDQMENDEPEVSVKTIQSMSKPARPVDEEERYFLPNRHHLQQGQSWAKREGRNRNVTTARSVGAAAVTGLARAKTGGGSLRQLAKTASMPTGTTVLKKSESVLISRLGDKSSRFTT